MLLYVFISVLFFIYVIAINNFIFLYLLIKVHHHNILFFCYKCLLIKLISHNSHFPLKYFILYNSYTYLIPFNCASCVRLFFYDPSRICNASTPYVSLFPVLCKSLSALFKIIVIYNFESIRIQLIQISFQIQYFTSATLL